MAFMDDLGSAFTGQSAAAGPMEPAEAKPRWDEWLTRPGNRQALLQIGLQMMQPVGIGQTTGGHIAQAIGAGGEAVGRNEQMDLKEAVAEGKLAQADARLDILNRNADSNAIRANAAATRSNTRKIGGITDAMKLRDQRAQEREYERQLDKDAAALEKRSSGTDALINPDDPVVKQYKGMTREQIRDKLRATRPFKRKATALDTADDDEEDETPVDATNPDTSTETPPYPGAQKAQDGNWYVPDPKRPGKYLQVK